MCKKIWFQEEYHGFKKEYEDSVAMFEGEHYVIQLNKINLNIHLFKKDGDDGYKYVTSYGGYKQAKEAKKSFLGMLKNYSLKNLIG